MPPNPAVLLLSGFVAVIALVSFYTVLGAGDPTVLSSAAADIAPVITLLAVFIFATIVLKPD